MYLSKKPQFGKKKVDRKINCLREKRNEIETLNKCWKQAYSLCKYRNIPPIIATTRTTPTTVPATIAAVDEDDVDDDGDPPCRADDLPLLPEPRSFEF